MLSNEFMNMAKETVVLSAFWFIILLDIWGIGYLLVHFIKWVHGSIRKLRGKDKNTEAETE